MQRILYVNLTVSTKEKPKVNIQKKVRKECKYICHLQDTHFKPKDN